MRRSRDHLLNCCHNHHVKATPTINCRCCCESVSPNQADRGLCGAEPNKGPILLCLDETGVPLTGYVEYIFLRDGLHVGSDAVDIDPFGSARVPCRGNLPPTIAHVKPSSGHWGMLVRHPSGATICRCAPMDRPLATNWWKHLLGRRGLSPNAGRGIRIGVIDLGFRPDPLLAHVVFRDTENKAIDVAEYPNGTHGSRVTKIIAERGTTEEREGMAPASDIVFVDVSEAGDKGTIDGELLGPAIELLADEYKVDVINISAGSYVEEAVESEYAAVLRKSVDYARKLGTLVVAATGNLGKHRPAIPACLEEVLGVGAVGQVGVAPLQSHVGTYEGLAREAGGAWGGLPQGPKIFHHVDTCSGPGLDVVAPGIGLTLCYDHEVIMECSGTSYSCPLVVGVLACALGRDEEYTTLQGATRSQRALDILRGIAQPLGMDILRQGAGLPVLPLLC